MRIDPRPMTLADLTRRGAGAHAAEAVRRGGFWGLSMLFVHPRGQSRGVGRQLLDKTLRYAEGADVRMILSSEDPRALRRYSRAGLSLHPGVLVEGTVDSATIPADLNGRTGSAEDLGLADEVDATIGRARRDDVASCSTATSSSRSSTTAHGAALGCTARAR